MKKDTFIAYKPWCRNGNFRASGTIDAMCACIVDREAKDTQSSEGVAYLQNINYLKQISTNAEATSYSERYFIVQKYDEEDQALFLADGNEDKTIEDGEDVIGVLVHPGLEVKCYFGEDYVNSSGAKLGLAAHIPWKYVPTNTVLFFNSRGQLTTATDTTVARAILSRRDGLYIYVKFLNPYRL